MGKNHFSHAPRTFDIAKEGRGPFVSNYVRTSKYTKLSFLPKSVLLQFKRLANIYFLLAAVIMEIKGVSSLSPASAIAPFIFVLACSVVREGFEDIPRQKSDKRVNTSGTRRLEKNGRIKDILWSDVRVGDIIVVKVGEEIPADLVLMASSNENGMAYIETGSLDGEKNLKPKYSLAETMKYFDQDRVENQNIYSCKIYAQTPEPLLHHFEGAFISEEGNKVALQVKQLLLRSSKLKNTNWAIGVVVYTGDDTKIMKNTERKKNKQSKVEGLVNKLILAIWGIQILVCIVTGFLNYIWSYSNAQNAAYLGETDNTFGTSMLVILSYLILTNTMIPISLIISLELVKVLQALFIEKDKEMYNPANGESTKVFSSSINEELGQVGYIFSDKTGTLTSNSMIFKNFVIGGEVYGEYRPKLYSSSKKDDPDYYQKEGYQTPSNLSNNPPSLLPLFRRQIYTALQSKLPLHAEFVISGRDLPETAIRTHRELILEFMQAVTTCHECIAEEDKNLVINYQGQSQDETRLLETARDAGFVYLGGGLSKVRVKFPDSEKEFEVLQIFEFNSDRKRMSVLIRDGDVLKLYVKGADNVICSRLNTHAPQPFQESVMEKLEEYSKIGYRTLVYAMRIVSYQEYEDMNNRLSSVADSDNREEEIEKIAEEFERNFYLLGCTAVEDKLQRNVPDVIHELLLADIKIWMATGDKLHTAENVAYSCRLIKGDTSVMRCVGETLEEVQAKMAQNKEIFDLCVKENRKKALIIQGDALAHVLNNSELKALFVSIALDCEAVVCCRVTPKQKADVVRLIKSQTDQVTLAVGDGANDVSMIQAADIGIGLYGQEGMQAVQASDFAISEFQSLWRLLLVHGRWSYLRIAEMILYFFYKNMLFTMPQVYFGVQCSFNGQTIYDDFYVSLYNLIFTAVPLVVKATLEQDINYKRIRPGKVRDEGLIIEEDNKIRAFFPRLYEENRSNPIFTIRSFIIWVLEGVIVAAILYFCGIAMLGDVVINSDGQIGGMWYFSIALYTTIIFVVNLKLAITTRSWTVIYIVFLILSLIVYLGFTGVYNLVPASVASYTIGMDYISVQFYGFLLLMAGTGFMVDLAVKALINEFRMPLADKLRVLQKSKGALRQAKISVTSSFGRKSRLYSREFRISQSQSLLENTYQPPRLY